MQGNRIQFAVVREDPEIEASVIRSRGGKRALLVASGGCTALSLQALDPELEITLFDFNSAQLGHVEKKMQTLRRLSGSERKRAFNVGSGEPSGLNACGNFESLFRQLRLFLNEFVFSADDVESAFRKASLHELLENAKSSKYWPAAFELHFSDALLNAMFGPDATQHAPQGSYPGYFRAAFERAMARADAAGNPFLQHILLGHYLDDDRSLLPYLRLPVPAQYHIKMIEGTLDRVPHLGDYDFISLSNLLDWSKKSEIERMADRLRIETRPGTALLYRQLNHTENFRDLFEPEFQFDSEKSAELLDLDRSFFYSNFNFAIRGDAATEDAHE